MLFQFVRKCLLHRSALTQDGPYSLFCECVVLPARDPRVCVRLLVTTAKLTRILTCRAARHVDHCARSMLFLIAKRHARPPKKHIISEMRVVPAASTEMMIDT